MQYDQVDRRRVRPAFALRTATLFLLVLPAACSKPPLTDNGVVLAFGGVGYADGDFIYPRAIDVDDRGCIYVVDKTGRIQRFSPDGTFEHSWRTPAIDAGKPVGISIHPDGRVFVPDTHYHRVLIYDRDGKLLDQFGTHGRGDGEFELPTDVAFDADGNIYVGEYYGNDRVTKWSPDLGFIQAIGETPIDGARLSRPAGLVVDDEQTLWVADACNHRLVRFSLSGSVLSVFGGFGIEPGQVRYPYDIDLAPDGSLVVCEYEGNRIQWFAKDGRSLRTWGEGGRELGQLHKPWGVACAAGGRFCVLDSYNSRVQVVVP